MGIGKRIVCAAASGFALVAACAQGTMLDIGGDRVNAGAVAPPDTADGGSPEASEDDASGFGFPTIQTDASVDRGSPPDGGPPAEVDSAVPLQGDSGAPEEDSSPPATDSGTPPVDSGADTAPPDEDAGPMVPTTCSEAYQNIGCCVGNTAYWCNSPNGSISHKNCASSGQVCGWDLDTAYYCVDPPVTVGAGHPINCQ